MTLKHPSFQVPWGVAGLKCFQTPTGTRGAGGTISFQSPGFGTASFQPPRTTRTGETQSVQTAGALWTGGTQFFQPPSTLRTGGNQIFLGTGGTQLFLGTGGTHFFQPSGTLGTGGTQ